MTALSKALDWQYGIQGIFPVGHRPQGPMISCFVFVYPLETDPHNLDGPAHWSILIDNGLNH